MVGFGKSEIASNEQDFRTTDKISEYANYPQTNKNKEETLCQ